MIIRLLFTLPFLCLIGNFPLGSQRSFDTPSAEIKAIAFLAREVPAWSRNNGCFSCHNDGDAARALYAASRKGYVIPQNALDATTAWVSKPEAWEHNKGNPGFSDKTLSNVQFGSALLAAFEAGEVKDRQPLELAATKLIAEQATDGAWRIDPDAHRSTSWKSVARESGCHRSTCRRYCASRHVLRS